MKIPDFIETFLQNYPSEWELFNKLPPSHQKQYIQWVEDAKKEETRINRLVKAVSMLQKPAN